jgi:hypothetical protein
MQIVFDLPHAFGLYANEDENARALRALLDCLTALNEGYLRFHNVMPLYKSGVRYGRTREWDTIPALYQRGYGDCKSLACALVAEYRKQGKIARAVYRWNERVDNGIHDYHILVQTADGQYEDPSKILGMGANEFAPLPQY